MLAEGSLSGAAAAAEGVQDPWDVLVCFRGMGMAEEGLRQLLSDVTGDVPGCNVLDLQEVANKQKKGSQKQQLQGCAISDSGLENVKQVTQLLKRSCCEAGSAVRLEHVPRQNTLTSIAPNSSSDTQQQLVEEAILWMLVLLWFAVPAEQQAAFSSWEPLRVAVAARPAVVG
jgi:hypothetical protein